MRKFLSLPGCTPTPLAHFLKALGVLRLVCEQRDGTATAAWQHDVLNLWSALDVDELVHFFLHGYKPTPVLNPWNGDGGFFEDSRAGAKVVLRQIAGSKAERFSQYREAIAQVRNTFERYQIREKPTDENKAEVLVLLRNELPETTVGWLDAVCIVSSGGPKYPPLLGSGGNDGSIDFAKNFMQRLAMVIDLETGLPTKESEPWLRSALFQTPIVNSATADKIGQFYPGAAGGPNGTTGFDAAPSVNPWDYVLMMEGTLLFAGASVRRLDKFEPGLLVYPFCVRQVGVGYASATVADEKDSRCELWVPLWSNPISLMELQAIFSEGRAQVGARPVRNGVDFARAAVTLGVDRGITAFQRYGFQKRNGESNFATPLGRIAVRRNVCADLLSDVDGWLNIVRQNAIPKKGDSDNKKPPASVTRALNLVERKIVDLCCGGSSDGLQAILIALGRAERALVRSFHWTKSNEDVGLRPLLLSPGWLEKAKTNSPEFRLACTIASTAAWLGDGRGKLWLRQHLEPVTIYSTQNRLSLKWNDQPSNDVVWHDGDLTDTLNDILIRRILCIEKSGAPGWPDWSPRPASLADITTFIEGRTDATLLADLLWGLCLLDWEKLIRDERTGESGQLDVKLLRPEHEYRAVPSALYALLRLCFRRVRKDEDTIPIVQGIHLRASQGHGTIASELAARHLRGCGRSPLVSRVPMQGRLARRTAASLIFPISDSDLDILEKYILNQPEETHR